MNTLAHFAIGYPDPELMLGQFLGDHVKGAVEEAPFSARVRQGIRDHRRIDALSDQHNITRFAKSLLPREQRRMGGVVMDLYGDALLVMTWDQLMDVPFSTFLEEAKRVLASPPEPLPPSATWFVNRITSGQLLECYADADELPELLDRIGSHLRRPQSLSPLLHVFRTNEEEFLRRFPLYFEEIRSVCP